MGRGRAMAALCVALSLAGIARAETLRVPDQYPTIEAALTGAQEGDVVLVARSTQDYTENVVLEPGVILAGEETAGTVLAPTGGTIVGAERATLRNFTIRGTVDLRELQDATVENNVILLKSSDGFGIRADTTPPDNTSPDPGTIRIRFNTFFGDSSVPIGTGVEITLPRGQSQISIVDNIFSGLGTSVNVRTGTDFVAPNIAGNLFFQNTKDPSVTPKDQNQVADPLFIDTRDLDFHVKKAGPACQVGAYATNSDHADWTPFPIAVSSVERRNGSVLVSWHKDEICSAGTVTYRVYASNTEGGDYAQVGGPTGGTSFNVPVENLGSGPDGLTPPGTPANLAASPRDRSLLVRWGESPDADGYRVFWQAEGAEERSADVGGATEYRIGGLKNGVTYSVSVSAYKADTRYFAVGATSSRSDLESRLPTSGREANVGPAPGAESEKSESITAVPEEIMGSPDLENKTGCFLQTLSQGQPSGSSGWTVTLVSLALVAVASARVRWRRVLLAALAAVFVLAPAAQAAEPRLVLGIMGGAFRPAEDSFEESYDHKWVPTGKVNVGLRPFRWLEFGIEGGYWKANGEARASTGEPADMTLEVLPVQAYGIVNLHFSERQWVVPYGGGGYSRYYYKRTIEDQDDVKGHLSGYHWRGGFKLLLNGLEPDSARRAEAYFSLKRTFFAVEAQWSKVEDDDRDTDLGGRSYWGGLLLEF